MLTDAEKRYIQKLKEMEEENEEIKQKSREEIKELQAKSE